MDWQALATDFRDNLWLYLSLPVISALIGWITKIVAVQMMFKPINFVGIPPWIGWQGVIPRNAAKMAGVAVDIMTARLLSVREVFERLDPERLSQVVREPLSETIEQVAMEVANRLRPGLWQSLPTFARRRIIERAQADIPRTVKEVMEDVRGNIEDLVDLKRMIVDLLLRDRELLNRIFWQTGYREFRFFSVAGLYFGFILGFVQMGAWALFREPWLLPAFGFFVGFFSDWLALQLLFRPLRPRRILGLRVQGLFLSRQQEVARDYGDLIARELLTPEHLWEALLKGPLAGRLASLVQRHVQRAVDENAGAARPLVTLVVGSRHYAEIKDAVAQRLLEALPQTLRHANHYAEEAMDIRNTLVRKMQAMTPEEFEGLLRPVFREDEWILIAVGAVLGFLVGELQVQIMIH